MGPFIWSLGAAPAGSLRWEVVYICLWGFFLALIRADSMLPQSHDMYYM